MIPTEKLHEQVESLSVTFTFDRKHVFGDLASALQFRYSEKEFTKFGRHVRIVRQCVLLKRLEYRFLRTTHTLRLFQSARVCRVKATAIKAVRKRMEIKRKLKMKRQLTGREEYDDLHCGVFKLVDTQTAQMVCEMDHALDAWT